MESSFVCLGCGRAMPHGEPWIGPKADPKFAVTWDDLSASPWTWAALRPPPPTLDGARVLWWARSGHTPFGEMPGAPEEDRWVYGFAVCQYDSGEIYRFSCNRHWKVVNDMDHDSEEEAKASIPLNYDAARVRWRRYDGG